MLFYMYSRKMFDGSIMWSFVLGYSLIRSIIEEPFRAVHWHWTVYNNEVLGIKVFTMTQLISIPLIIISIIMLYRAAKQHKSNMERLRAANREYYELGSLLNNVPLPAYPGNPKNDSLKSQPSEKSNPKAK